MGKIDGTPIEIFQQMTAEYIYPATKRIKISSESNQFCGALVDVMQDFPENEEEIDLSEIKTLIDQLRTSFGLNLEKAKWFFSNSKFKETLL